MGTGAFVYATVATVFAAILAEVLASVVSRDLPVRLSQRGASCLWAALAVLAWGLAAYAITHERHYLVSLYVEAGFWPGPDLFVQTLALFAVAAEPMGRYVETVSPLPFALLVFPVSPLLNLHAKPSSTRQRSLFLGALIFSLLCAVFGVASVSVQETRDVNPFRRDIELLVVPFFVQMLVLFGVAKVAALRIVQQPPAQPQRGAQSAD